MVKDVVSAPDNIGIEEAREILYKNRIEKLPLVDKGRRVVGINGKSIVIKGGEKKMDINTKKVKLVKYGKGLRFTAQFLPPLKKVGILGGVR